MPVKFRCQVRSLLFVTTFEINNVWFSWFCPKQYKFINKYAFFFMQDKIAFLHSCSFFSHRNISHAHTQLAMPALKQTWVQCFALGHMRWSGTSRFHSMLHALWSDLEQRPSACKVKSWQAEQCYSCPLHNNAMTHSLLWMYLIFLSQHWGKRQNQCRVMALDVSDGTDLHPMDVAIHKSLIFTGYLISLLPHLFDNLLVTFKCMTASVAQVVLHTLKW